MVSNTKRVRMMLATLTILMSSSLFAFGCGVNVDDEDEAVGVDAEELKGGAPNHGVNPRKVCAKLDSNAGITFLPGGGGVVESLTKGQYVLVQTSPGLVKGHLWVDPGLFGLSDAQFRDRCDAKGSRPATKQRRGWIRASALRSVGGKALPNDDDFTPEGNGKSASGKLTSTKVKAACTLPGELGTYGNVNGAIYLNFNTHDISGGGIAFGYVTASDTFGMVYTTARADRQHPEVTWVYGKSHLMNHWGWVPINCLE